MHFDRVADFSQGHSLEAADAALEESLLPLHDLRDDLDDGLGALVERLHQPVGAGVAFAEPGL